MFQLLRNGEALEHSDRFVDGTVAQFLLEARHGGVRNRIQHVELAREEVSVGGVELGIEDELHALVLSLAVAFVAVIGNDGGAFVVGPLLQLVGSAAHGLFAVGIHVIKSGIGKREEGRVAETVREVSFRLVQLHGKCFVINNLQAFHRLSRFIPLNGFEVGGSKLIMFHDIVPCLDKVISFDGGVVGEGHAVFEGDAVGFFALKLNGFSEVFLGFTLCVVVHQTGVDHVDDATTTVFIGITGKKGMLGFGAVDNDIVPVAAAASRARGAGSHSDCERCCCEYSDCFLKRHEDLQCLRTTRRAAREPARFRYWIS